MLPMLGITGYSGSGKTTLLEKLLPQLAYLKLRVSVIKHSHHNTQIDTQGKDSWKMTRAGASQVAMVCDQRWALMTETPNPVNLSYLAQQFDTRLTDLILVEGFKQEPIEKILVHRQSMGKPLPEIDDKVIALATDYSISFSSIPCMDLNHVDSIAQFIFHWYQQRISITK